MSERRSASSDQANVPNKRSKNERKNKLLSDLRETLRALDGKWNEHEKDEVRSLLESVPVTKILSVAVTKMDGTSLSTQCGSGDLVGDLKENLIQQLETPPKLQSVMQMHAQTELSDEIQLSSLLSDGEGTLRLTIVVKPSDKHFKHVVVLVNPDHPYNVNKASGQEMKCHGVVTLDSHCVHYPYTQSINFASKHNVGFSIPYSDSFNFGMDDVTIEAWVRIEPGTRSESSEGVRGPNPMLCNAGTSSVIVPGLAKTDFECYCREVVYRRRDPPLPGDDPTDDYVSVGYNNDRELDDGSFHHYAFVRHQGNMMMFLDGKLKIDKSTPTGVFDSRCPLFIGSIGRTRQWRMGVPGGLAHMSEFRITKGIARYLEDFEAPTSFPVA